MTTLYYEPDTFLSEKVLNVAKREGITFKSLREFPFSLDPDFPLDWVDIINGMGYCIKPIKDVAKEQGEVTAKEKPQGKKKGVIFVPSDLIQSNASVEKIEQETNYVVVLINDHVANSIMAIEPGSHENHQ